MPKPDNASPNRCPLDRRLLPPDFPDIPQNPSSELQPPSDPSAMPDQFAGATPARAKPETLRRKNARLRAQIDQVLEKHPEPTTSLKELL
jgi:hypothetical protein